MIFYPTTPLQVKSFKQGEVITDVLEVAAIGGQIINLASFQAEMG